MWRLKRINSFNSHFRLSGQNVTLYIQVINSLLTAMSPIKVNMIVEDEDEIKACIHDVELMMETLDKLLATEVRK